MGFLPDHLVPVYHHGGSGWFTGVPACVSRMPFIPYTRQYALHSVGLLLTCLIRPVAVFAHRLTLCLSALIPAEASLCSSPSQPRWMDDVVDFMKILLCIAIHPTSKERGLSRRIMVKPANQTHSQLLETCRAVQLLPTLKLVDLCHILSFVSDVLRFTPHGNMINIAI